MRPTTAPRTKIALAVLGLTVSLLVLAATVGSAPSVCGSCHAMKPFAQALERSSHADVHCYACHLARSTGGWPGFKATELTRMYLPGLLGAEVTGSTTRIERGNCLACHEDVLTATTESGIRISHGLCAPTGSCDTCHSAIAHGEATRWITMPVMEDCIACHREQGASVDCGTCHTDKSQTARLSQGPWAITHGANWEKTHGMGDLRTCGVCHEPSKCAGCHEVGLPHPAGFGQTHSTDALAHPDSCAQCHDRQSFCAGCHGIEMPHPQGFLPDHRTIATGHDDASCITCHQQQDCDRCHVMHTHPGNTDGTIGDTLPKVDD
ncbi:MAG: hypothetical protein ACYDHQ_02045 [Coriobacteriia bacterium]